MFRLALLAALAFSAPASAATCAQMVSGVEAWLAAHPDKAGTRPQTVAAQLQHQPTRDSVAKAKMDSRDNLTASLAKAKAKQAAGDAAGCRATLDYVGWMIKP